MSGRRRVQRSVRLTVATLLVCIAAGVVLAAVVLSAAVGAAAVAGGRDRARWRYASWPPRSSRPGGTRLGAGPTRHSPSGTPWPAFGPSTRGHRRDGRLPRAARPHDPGPERQTPRDAEPGRVSTGAGRQGDPAGRRCADQARRRSSTPYSPSTSREPSQTRPEDGWEVDDDSRGLPTVVDLLTWEERSIASRTELPRRHA